MNVFAYILENEKDKKHFPVLEKSPLIGDVWVVLDVEKESLHLKSQTGRIDAKDILMDIFPSKLVSGTGAHAKCINRNKTHFTLLNMRLRNID